MVRKLFSRRLANPDIDLLSQIGDVILVSPVLIAEIASKMASSGKTSRTNQVAGCHARASALPEAQSLRSHLWFLAHFALRAAGLPGAS